MDWFGFLMFGMVLFVIMSCCGFCCKKRRRGAVLAPPIVTTIATPQTSGYSVTQVSIPGARINSSAPYPTQQYAAAYPIQSMQPPPLPTMPHLTGLTNTAQPAPGLPPYAQAYPAMQPPQAANMNPPPYDFAVANDESNRQPAYNPNYVNK